MLAKIFAAALVFSFDSFIAERRCFVIVFNDCNSCCNISDGSFELIVGSIFPFASSFVTSSAVIGSLVSSSFAFVSIISICCLIDFLKSSVWFFKSSNGRTLLFSKNFCCASLETEGICDF